MDMQIKNNFIEKAYQYLNNKKTFSTFLTDMGWEDWMQNCSQNKKFLQMCWQDAQELMRWS